MANSKISALTSLDKTTIAAADLVPVVDTSAATTKNIRYDELIQPQDTHFRISGGVDSTKKVQFEVDGLTTGTTRVITIPDASTTMVGTDTTQTMTNKTLTSPKVNLGTDATGDIYYRDGTGNLARLPIGSAGQILDVSGSGLPEWIANPAATNGSTTTKGVYETATAAEINAGTTTGATGAELAVTAAQLALSNYVKTYLEFGSGVDGDVVISGTTTLTRDMNYNNLTINSSQILNTAGYRIFVKGTLTNGGTIRNNGSNGTAGTGGTGVGGSGAAAGTLLGGYAGGNGHAGGGGGGGIVWISAKTVAVQGTIQAIGGNGANGTGATGGVVGSNGTATPRTLIQSGTGGNGGSAGANAGGTGAGRTVTSLVSPYSLPILTMFHDSAGQLAGGAGGGGGAENGAGPNAGGGGGGMGGVVIFIYNSITTPGTISVAGGSGGTPFSTGNTGAAGSSGLAISIQI